MTTNHSHRRQSAKVGKARATPLSLYTYASVLPFSFCLVLHRLLDQHDTTLEVLADLTGIRDKVIRQHLNGNLSPTAAEMDSYASAFGYSPEQFREECRYVSASGTAAVQLAIDAVKIADEKAMARNEPTGSWIERVIREA